MGFDKYTTEASIIFHDLCFQSTKSSEALTHKDHSYVEQHIYLIRLSHSLSYGVACIGTLVGRFASSRRWIMVHM